jgi:cytosine/adenosine deaminase-related metal-dependent hydrolase
MGRLILSNVITPFHPLKLSFSISVEGDSIHQINELEMKGTDNQIEFEPALIIPGLFNAHDHLEFSLYPQLGRRQYQNYLEWGNDIHQNFKQEIKNVLDVPFEDRWRMGMLKNLLSGVTTVIDHGFHRKHPETPLINLHNGFQYIHSLGTDKNWKIKVNLPYTQPIMIHLGEGTDQVAYGELKKIMKNNFLHRKIIGVHLIDGDPQLFSKLNAMIWCPDSNLFLYGKTPSIHDYQKMVRVLFGTDSPVSASPNIWDHFRLARRISQLSEQELYFKFTAEAYQFFRLKRGALEKGSKADFVLLKLKAHDAVVSFFESNPEDVLLVVKDGLVLVFDESLKEKLKGVVDESLFSPLVVGSAVKFVLGNWSDLIIRLQSKKFNLPLGVQPLLNR